MTNASELTQKPASGTPKTEARRGATPETVLRPLVDIYESNEGITVQADLPGVAKERLNVHVEGSNLLIEGTIGVAPQEEMTAVHAEVRSTVYRRSFTLSNELETQKIEATLKDGQLTVRIPKRAELQPRRIEVKT